MSFCTNCGTQLDAGTKFCGECGTVAPVPAPVAAPADPVPAPPKSNAKRIIMILLIPIIAIIAGLATTATVVPTTTSLYREQSAKSTVLKTLKKDEVIIVTGLPANGWAPVKSGNISGWVLLSSITIKR